MREAQIEKILVAEVKKLGGRAYKWVSPGNAGMPDRIVIFPNSQPIFVELKTAAGKLSALQKVQCERLIGLGQHVEILYGIDGLSQFFQHHGFAEVSEAITRRYKLVTRTEKRR